MIKKDLIYKDLKKKILELKIKTHDVLKEEDLALKYKVSRTPVREALQLLEKDGFLKKVKKVGFILKPLTKKDFKEIVEIRSILESYAAKLTTQNYSKNIIEKLKKINEASKKYIENKDIEKFFKNNSEFHNLIYKSSKNERLISLINNLHDSFTRYRIMLIRISNIPEKSYNDHKMMIQAMEEKNEKKVEELVKTHILEGGKILLNNLDRDDLGIIQI
jgi:DNA-binding GntR family transcriptional regulator